MSKHPRVSKAATVLPAHETKHIPELEYNFQQCTFRLGQLNNGLSNGTALWLGAQCLSAFLAHVYGTKHRPRRSGALSTRPRVIELGSGIGLSALALSSLGWDVVATDLSGIVDAVLASNIANNVSKLPPDSGTIQVRVLDWTVPPEDWSWENDGAIASAAGTQPTPPPAEGTALLAPPFDLIITADTIYSAELAGPLLRTLKALTEQSVVTNTKGIRTPPVYLCLERRDPALADQTLADAADFWKVRRIPHGKVTHALEKGGLIWDKSDWEDVELWILTHKSS